MAEQETNAKVPEPKKEEPKTTPKAKSDKTLIYLIIAVVAVAIIAVLLVVFTNHPANGTTPGSTLNGSIQNQNLTQNEALFESDIQKTATLNGIVIQYLVGNITNPVVQIGNVTAVEKGNQTITAYEMGPQVRANYTVDVNYRNSVNNTLVGTNSTSLYYYNTLNGSVSCLSNSYSILNQSNSSLTCFPGYGGYPYLQTFPFTFENYTSLEPLIGQGAVEYLGTGTYLGRNCDDFVFSNETTGAPTFYITDLCLDSQYGFPLYLNFTAYQYNQSVYSSVLMTQKVSLNVNESDFIIPANYISNETLI